MRTLLWYCDRFAWRPAIKTLADAPPAEAADYTKTIVAFVHVEPQDISGGNSAETKLVKNAKWLARKWDVQHVILHSFSHLGQAKAEPDAAQALLGRAQQRLQKAGYPTVQTPYGYFNDLSLEAPGHPLARVFKSF